jgi:hypothetical protein
MTFKVVIFLAFVALGSAISVTKGGKESEMTEAISSCHADDKDCAYLAFNVYRHFNPDSQFVVDTLEVQDTMRGFIADCEAEDADCNSVKAYAFQKVFPDSEAAKADLAKSPLDLTNEKTNGMVAEIDTCLSEDPLCIHLIIKEFCTMDGSSAACQSVADADEKFEVLIKTCEGRMGKFCKKIADEAACKFFPAACNGKAKSKLAEFAKKMAEKQAERMAKFDAKKEVKDFAKDISACAEEDSDCAYLAFRTYRHFFPASAFVKKVTAIEDQTEGQIEACTEDVPQCNALKAMAFAHLFPDSEDAKADLAKWPLDLSLPANKEMEAGISTCMTENPLCKHIIMASFCGMDGNNDNVCESVAAADDKFEAIIEKCESNLGKFCGKIAKKGACKFFQATCDE